MIGSTVLPATILTGRWIILLGCGRYENAKTVGNVHVGTFKDDAPQFPAQGIMQCLDLNSHGRNDIGCHLVDVVETRPRSRLGHSLFVQYFKSVARYLLSVG